MTTKTNVSSENFSWLQSISYRLGFFSSATGSSRSGKNPTVLIGHSYNANDPSEDRWLVKSDPANDWDIGCVLDGHGGWQVSDYVSHKIIDLIVKYVLQSNSNLSATSIEERLIGVFEELENSYIQSIRSVYKLGYGEVAKVGSCALVAIRRGKSLTIANAGDCRAVIGTQAKSPSSKDDHKNENRYYATRITMDHNCREPLEDFRLRQAHPNESDIVICKTSHACYVKGRLQLTRALGDVYLKHQEFNAPPTKQSRGRYIPEPYTPPYVLFRPDVHQIQLDSDDRFLILATDGVWDFLSDQEAVDIVKSCSDGKAAAEMIVQRAITRAAEECNMTVDALKALPPGSKRRSLHDDTTAVVMYF